MVALVGQWWLDTRSPDKQRGGRPPGQPGLQRPGAPRAGAGAWSTGRPGPDEGSGQSRRRAPGTGPVHRADGAEDARPRPARRPAGRRRPRRAASAATVGPEPLTSAATAPASVAARSARRSSGPQGERRRLQVVAQRGRRVRTAARSRSAAMTGSGERQRRSPSGTAPGRAQPVELARRPPAWTARRRRCPAPSASGRRASTGDSCSPRPGAERDPAEQAEGHVAAELAPPGRPGRRGRPGCPRARRGRRVRPRRRRCRRRGPRRPGSTWRSSIAASAGTPACCGEQLGGPPDQVAAVGRDAQPPAPSPVTETDSPSPGPHRDRVEQRDGEVDRPQLVEAVGPQRADAEVHVDLRRGARRRPRSRLHRVGRGQPGEVGDRQLLAAGRGVDPGGPQPRLGRGGAARPPGERGAQALAAGGEGGVDDGEGARRSPSGGGRRTSATSPESTLGSGQNTRRPTFPARRTSPYQAALTDGTP